MMINEKESIYMCMFNALEDMGYDDDDLNKMSYEELVDEFESIYGSIEEFLEEIL